MAKEGQLPKSPTPRWNPNEETLTTFLDGLETEFNNRNITENQERTSYLIRALPPIFRNALKIVSNEGEIANQEYHEIVQEIKQQLIPQTQPSKSKWWHRAQLHQRRQKSKESVQEYKSALLTLARNCELHYHQDITLTMVFISGIRDKFIRKRLLDYQGEQNFLKATDYALEMEAEKAAETVKQNNDNSIASTAKGNGDMSPRHHTSTTKSKNHPEEGQSQRRNRDDGKAKKACYRCGSYSHLAVNCAYKQLYCNWCERKGHIARECYDKRDYDEYYYGYDD